MKMQKIKNLIPAVLAFAPMIAMAAETSLRTIIRDLTEIILDLVMPLIVLALVIFIWGVIKYITAGDEEEKRSKARNTILYGVIGLFAIVAVWGLVKVIANTFSIDVGGTIGIPEFKI